MSKSNGCGCQSGLLRFFKPPYAERFYAACCLHDNAYDIGGDRSDRMRADVELYHNIVRIAERERSPWKALWLTLWAFSYYVSVRAIGGAYFNWREKGGVYAGDD